MNIEKAIFDDVAVPASNLLWSAVYRSIRHANEDVYNIVYAGVLDVKNISVNLEIAVYYGIIDYEY